MNSAGCAQGAFSILRLRRLETFPLLALLVVGHKGFGGLRRPGVPIQSPQHEEKPHAASFDALYQSGINSLRAGHADIAAESLTQALRLDPNNKPARCALGQAFVNSARLVEAIEQFRECVRLDPNDIQSQYNLGQAYLRLALTTAGALLERNDTSSYARRIFAENYVGKNDFTEAEAQYRMALRTEPEARDLRLSLGDMYLSMGKVAQARGEFQQTLDAVPTSLVAHCRLADADFLEQNFSSALTRLRFVAGLDPGFLRSGACFTALPASGPSLHDVCSGLSKVAPTLPDDSALAFLRSVCDGKASAGKPWTSGNAVSRGASPPANDPGAEEHKLTLSQLCLGGFCRACADRLRSVTTLSSPSTQTLSELGQCSLETGDYESAFGYFLEAHKRNDNSLALLYWLQESARRSAGQSFDRIRQIDPDSYLVHLLNAQSLEDQQQRAEAIQEYKAAIARRPDAANIRVLLGHLQWKWQDYDDALQQLMEALRLEPDNIAANYLVGDIWVQERAPERALPYLNKVLALRPGFLNAEASLGRALLQLGKLQEALEELKAVAKADQDGSIHYELYQVYQRLGRKDEASAALAASGKIRSERRQTQDLP